MESLSLIPGSARNAKQESNPHLAAVYGGKNQCQSDRPGSLLTPHPSGTLLHPSVLCVCIWKREQKPEATMLLVLHANWTSFIAFPFVQASAENMVKSCKLLSAVKPNVTQMWI